MKKLFSAILAAFLLVFSFAPMALAQGNLNSALDHLGESGQKAGTSQTDLATVVGSGIRAALTLVGLIFLVLMVYAGYLWMTARGETDQVDKAKNIISAAIIGLVLVMSAYAITVLVTRRFAQ